MSTVLAEEPGVTRWGVEDGLPLDHITALAQTPDGFVWIGTFDGLVRFDGRTFTTLRAAELPGLSGDRIVDLQTSPDGALWIITEAGQLSQLQGDDVRPHALPVPADGFAWIGDEMAVLGEEGPRFWDDGRWLPEPEDPRLAAALDQLGRAGPLAWADEAPGTLHGLHLDESDRLWVARDDGLFRLDDETLVEVPWPESEPMCGLTALDDGALLVRSRTRWGSLSGDVLAVGSPVLVDDCSANLRLQARHNGVLWRLSDHGLLRGDQLVLPLQGGSRALMVDADGGAWVGTEGAGLYRVRPSVFSVIGEAEGLPGDNIRAVSADAAGRVWVTVAEVPALSRIAAGRGEVLGGPQAKHLLALSPSSGGGMWVGGLEALCEHDGSCEPIPLPEARAPQFSPVALLEHDGLVVASEEGVRRWAAGRWERLTGAPGASQDARTLAVLSGKLLVGTRGEGLLKVGDRGIVAVPGLSSRRIRGITIDEGGAWVGTEGGGLCRVSDGPAGLAGRCLGTAAGLHADTIHTARPDRRGRLWLSSNTGVAVVSIDKIEAVLSGASEGVEPLVLTEDDGLRSREGNGTHQPASAVTPDGRLWFATQGGVAVVDPDAFSMPEPPAVHLTGLTVDGEPAPHTGPVRLTAAQREVAVSWTAPELSWPEQVRYQYRLVGYSDDWSAPTAEQQARWLSLPPGALQIEIRAGLGGAWGAPRILPLHRRAAFTETLWFPLLFGFLALGLAGAGARLRIRLLKQRQAELEDIISARTRELSDKNRRLALQTDQLSYQHEQLEVRHAQVRAQAVRLREIDVMKTRFVANISHELRTPVSLIAGPLSDVLQAEALSDADRSRLDRALQNARRLHALTEQILDVARLDEGGIPLRVRRQELGPFLRRVCERFTDGARARGLTLSTVAPEDPIFAYFDPDLLDKVVTNLVGNALKFTEQGTITVEAAAAGDDQVRVAVIDTGPGIPEPTRRRLFERFYQADASATRRHSGAGIGLALTAELVSLHGGEIGADSTPGQGSTFWFTLPLGAVHLSPDEIDTSPPTAPVLPPLSTPARPSDVDDARPVVVLAEDHPDMRAYIREHLEESFAVAEAADGEAALALVQQLRPAAVVSDVMMPGIDGIELCRRLKQDPALGSIPVLLVTARAAEQDRVEGLGVADDYLTKPFLMPELIARVRRLLRSHPEATEATPSRPVAEQEFIDRLDATVRQGLPRRDFNVTALAKEMALSSRQLRREVLRLTDQSPKDYLRQHRMSAARAMLQAGQFATVSEVAAAVGMTPTYFSRVYAAWAGHAPSADMA